MLGKMVKLLAAAASTLAVALSVGAEEMPGGRDRVRQVQQSSGSQGDDQAEHKAPEVTELVLQNGPLGNGS